MKQSDKLVEIWRGPFLESRHRGHIVISDAAGDILESWGDPELVFLPRSSCKMIQALPLIESGAADSMGLSPEQLALACASHQGAEIHTSRVTDWLKALELSDDDLRCGVQIPADRPARIELIRADDSLCQVHNNCSGKHAGFLTLSKHLSAGPEYIEIDHPVQKAALEVFEELTNISSPGHAIDGCSAPNFATTMQGLASAMARMAAKNTGSTVRNRASERLLDAMLKHPVLVAGEGRACTELMRAMNGRVVVKTGAEAVFIAIIPELGLGVSVKIEDGATRASAAAIAAVLVRLGVLDADHPTAQKWMTGPIRNRRDLITGEIRTVL